MQEKQKEQLEADRDKLYGQFISLKYDYSAVELTPRPGYTNHGSHTDDIPIEVKLSRLPSTKTVRNSRQGKQKILSK